MMVKRSLYFLIFVFILSACADDEPDINPLITVDDFSTTLVQRPDEQSTLGVVSIQTELENVSYSITNLSLESAISIDSKTGVLTVNDASLFDINEVQSIHSEVVVSGGNASQKADVTINLALPEETISYFLDIALGFEFGNVSEVTRKWREDMKIFIGGEPSETLSSELNAIIREINFLTGDEFSVEIVGDTLASNYYIFFGSGNAYARIS